ncbi:MAG TPA: class I SAM-dependent methyltransferase [Phycisphaerales bacterium]|nr:class I SAM-dependent methyltransferase [Phycisphaerales bacterium]
MPAASSTPTSPTSTDGAMAPHPPIEGYYGQPAEKRAFLTSIFDETAVDYDKVEHWLSLGSGKWYRREALRRARLKPGMHVADVATGTGLVAREALRLMTVDGAVRGSLVGVDPSAGMLAEARKQLGIDTRVATAENLPFDDAAFDFLSMGYALRHVEDIAGAFREYHRVLKPGGRVCVLEITRPRTKFGRGFLKLYLHTVGAIISKMTDLAPRTPELWDYYWETIDRCVPPERVVAALKEAGFEQVERQVVCGVFSEYRAVRPG